MSDLYGAPSGIIAADKEARENLHSGLLAAKTLGEIEAQPTELRLKGAHADYYQGLAAEHLAKARDMQTLQQLDLAVTQARAQGVDLTVQDGQRIAAGPQSLAKPLEEQYQFGLRRGVPARLLVPLADKAATIRQKEAAAVNSSAEAEVRTLRASKLQAERLGALATWGMQGPAAYQQMRAAAVEQGLPIDGLPDDYEEALPILRGTRDSSLSVKEQSDLKIRERQLEARKARNASQNAVDSARITLMRTRKDRLQQDYDLIQKNGGKDSPEALSARRALIASRRSLVEARERKDFPPAPLDPTARTFGKSYTAANGAHFVWQKDPTTGKGMAVQIMPKAAAAESQVDSTDDGDDEGED